MFTVCKTAKIAVRHEYEIAEKVPGTENPVTDGSTQNVGTVSLMLFSDSETSKKALALEGSLRQRKTAQTEILYFVVVRVRVFFFASFGFFSVKRKKKGGHFWLDEKFSL